MTGDDADIAFHDHPDFILGAVAVDGGHGFHIGIAERVPVPSDDLLVALVGHGDEGAVSANAPEDRIGLLLVGDVHDFSAGDMFGEQGEVWRDPAVFVEFVDEFADFSSIALDEEQDIVDERGSHIFRAVGGLLAGFDIRRRESLCGVRRADCPFVPRGSYKQFGLRIKPVDAVAFGGRKSETCRTRCRGSKLEFFKVVDFAQPQSRRLFAGSAEAQALFVERHGAGVALISRKCRGNPLGCCIVCGIKTKPLHHRCGSCGAAGNRIDFHDPSGRVGGVC